MTAGYSGTPLPRKLGIGAGHQVAIVGPPDGHAADIEGLLAPLPHGASLDGSPEHAAVTLLFVVERSDLEARVTGLGKAIFPDRTLWVCWPKKASKVLTDVTEDVIREVALPLGLVDVKVCAVSDVWSGLKLVWRKDRR